MSPFGTRCDLFRGHTWALLPDLPQHVQPNSSAGTWAPGSDLYTLTNALLPGGLMRAAPILISLLILSFSPRAIIKGSHSSAWCCLSQSPSLRRARASASLSRWSQTPGHREATDTRHKEEPNLLHGAKGCSPSCLPGLWEGRCCWMLSIRKAVPRSVLAFAPHQQDTRLPSPKKSSKQTSPHRRTQSQHRTEPLSSKAGHPTPRASCATAMPPACPTKVLSSPACSTARQQLSQPL